MSIMESRVGLPEEGEKVTGSDTAKTNRGLSL